MYPPVEAPGGQELYSHIYNLPEMWIAFGPGLLSVRCIDRSSFLKIVPLFSDTSD